jgi:hypothetical protein
MKLNQSAEENPKQNPQISDCSSGKIPMPSRISVHVTHIKLNSALPNPGRQFRDHELANSTTSPSWVAFTARAKA